MPPKFVPQCGLICFSLLGLWVRGVASANDDTDESEKFYQAEIQPLLASKCIKCHGPEKQQGGLRLDRRDAVIDGGDRGPGAVPHEPEESLIMTAVGYSDADLQMPPDGKLSDADITRLATWVKLGLPWTNTNSPLDDPEKRQVVTDEHRRHWAFLPLRQVAKPPVNEPQRVRSQIDAFVLHVLEKDGLSFGPEADPIALVRRVFFDVLGLPPSPDQVNTYLQDISPDAYERLVDRVLDSPHLGERWGRHWLDGAGYADVGSTDNDASIIHPLENRWLYRDYVIQSLNRDKPFDQFLTEQLAGDELFDWRTADVYTNEMRESLIATGFLRMSSDDTFASELNVSATQHAVLERTIEIVANDLLGLSLACAKCHDHKYEPIPQRDYYQIKAIFQPAFNPDNWKQPAQRQIPAVSASEKKQIDSHNADLDRQLGELKSLVTSLRKPYEIKLSDQKFAELLEPIRADTKTSIETAADKRNEIQKYLASKFEETVRVKPEEVTASLSEVDKRTMTELETRIKDFTGAKKGWQNWQVLSDVGPPTPTRILKRGNPLAPGDEAAPGFLSVLSSSSDAATFPRGTESASTSRRRLSLARWLTDTRQPAGALAIRVRINRVWQQLFGKALVETADNLGLTGATPSHPELFEWLANEYASGTQELKPFLRRILISSVYRQSSTNSDERARRLDPDNRRLGRQRLRRLESEAVRDAILAVSGTLDTRLGGEPIPVEPRPDGSFVVKLQGLPANTSPDRRGIYLLARRNYHPTLLSAFDQPNLTTNCTTRQVSAVVLQSLAMLNDQFVLDHAEATASRVISLAGADPEKRLSAAFQFVLGRTPKTWETAECQAMIQKEIDWRQRNEPACTTDEVSRRALVRLCHTLLNTSEFLYIP